jgi:dihydroorotate dehydrogenase
MVETLLMNAVWPFTRPALFCIDPERAHGMAITALKLGLGGADRAPNDPILATTVCGLKFPNPIGMAAGFDKEAAVPDALLALGFGFSEAGTVTPLPQPGNSKPRMFRLVEDEAVINALGFNSGGLGPYVANLKARRARNASGIVGANVGKNKVSTDAIADYVTGIEAVTSLADYLVVNISSPNTPGLRALQARKEIQALIEAALAARGRSVVRGAGVPPLFVKIAPDLDDAALADIAEVARSTRVDGLIMGNTTIARPASLRSRDKGATGGLSGRPLMAPSTERLGALYKLLEGTLPLIGVGGVASGADAYAKIRAGASLVQLYSALVYHGPGLVGRIKRDLAQSLRADGFKSVAEAVGADHRTGARAG